MNIKFQQSSKTLFLALLAIGLCTRALAQANKAPSKSVRANFIADVERSVRFHAEKFAIPGGAFGLIIDGEIVHTIAEGKRGAAGKEQINASTLFQIGSIAKTFASTLAAKLVEQKKLNFDDSLKKHLPHRCSANQCLGITLKHLLSHTSGISSSGLNQRIENGERYEEVVSKALNSDKICPPGKCFQYNNVAFELLREVLEKVSGRNYFDLLKQEILTPLDMKETSATYSDLIAYGNYFVPHVASRKGFRETKHSTAYYNFPGSSLLNVNLNDMLKFLNAELGNSPTVISTAMLQSTHQSNIETRDAYAWIEQPRDGTRFVSQYGLGHRILQFRDIKVVFHSGWIQGSKNIIAMIPERRVGFVLLQNTNSQLGFRVLEDVTRLLRTTYAKL